MLQEQHPHVLFALVARPSGPSLEHSGPSLEHAGPPPEQKPTKAPFRPLFLTLSLSLPPSFFLFSLFFPRSPIRVPYPYPRRRRSAHTHTHTQHTHTQTDTRNTRTHRQTHVRAHTHTQAYTPHISYVVLFARRLLCARSPRRSTRPSRC